MPSTSRISLQPRALLLAMLLHHAVDQHAFAQAELLDHRAGHEGIGPLAGVVGRRVAEEAVAVGVHFEHAGAGLERQRLAVFAAARNPGDPGDRCCGP